MSMCVLSSSSFGIQSSNFRPCLWFLAKNKNTNAKRGFRAHRKQTLFIDARKLGTFIDRSPPVGSTAYLWN